MTCDKLLRGCDRLDQGLECGWRPVHSGPGRAQVEPTGQGCRMTSQVKEKPGPLPAMPSSLRL